VYPHPGGQRRSISHLGQHDDRRPWWCLTSVSDPAQATSGPGSRQSPVSAGRGQPKGVSHTWSETRLAYLNPSAGCTATQNPDRRHWFTPSFGLAARHSSRSQPPSRLCRGPDVRTKKQPGKRLRMTEADRSTLNTTLKIRYKTTGTFPGSIFQRFLVQS
jgi:hypothetical protein